MKTLEAVMVTVWYSKDDEDSTSDRPGGAICFGEGVEPLVTTEMIHETLRRNFFSPQCVFRVSEVDVDGYYKVNVTVDHYGLPCDTDYFASVEKFVFPLYLAEDVCQ